MRPHIVKSEQQKRYGGAVEYLSVVSAGNRCLSARNPSKHSTNPAKIMLYNQYVLALWASARKSACRWFDSAPGHHEIRNLDLPSQHQLGNIESRRDKCFTTG